MAQNQSIEPRDSFIQTVAHRAVAYALLAHMSFMVLVIIWFLSAYGGLGGNLPWGSGPPQYVDPIDNQIAEVRVIFNRWYIDRSQMGLVDLFTYINLPTFLVTRSIWKGLEFFFPYFRGPYPFGLSYGTYSLGFPFLLTPIQWYVIGIGIRRLLLRLASSRERPS